jgi:adenylyltransferase/sulfurtransferase
MVPTCAEGGVLGVLPGIIGVIQAIEAVKLIVGIGEPLIGRLLHFDALKMKFREFKLRKDPQCPVCGDHPTITELIDYDQFCGIPQAAAAAEAEEADLPEISVTQLQAKLAAGEDFLLLDVRERYEWEIARIEGAKLIPQGELPSRMSELDSAQEIAVFCKNGARSVQVMRSLREAGFGKLVHVRGGADAWAREVDRGMATY